MISLISMGLVMGLEFNSFFAKHAIFMNIIVKTGRIELMCRYSFICFVRTVTIFTSSVLSVYDIHMTFIFHQNMLVIFATEYLTPIHTSMCKLTTIPLNWCSDKDFFTWEREGYQVLLICPFYDNL